MATFKNLVLNGSMTSSIIAGYAYREENACLALVLNTGETYLYADVPVEVVLGLLGADSPGAYFVANIKGKYEYKKAEGLAVRLAA